MTISNIFSGMPHWIPVAAPLLFILFVWILFWKGVALWHASRRNQPWWFVVLLIVNTVGILEIVYLFAILKLKFSELLKRD